MITCWEQILETMNQIPVIDSHEHFVPEPERARYRDILTEYAGQYLGHDLISAGMPVQQYEKVLDTSCPLEERIRILRPWLALTENTGYGRCMKKSLKYLCSLEELTQDNVLPAQKGFETMDEKGQGYLLEQLGIEACVVDWMPLEWRFDEEIYVQAYDPLFLLMPESRNRLLKLEEFTGIPVRDYHSYILACRSAIEKKAKEQKVRILKIPLAYHRALEFEPLSREQAETEFNLCIKNIIHYRGGLSAGLGFGQSHGFQNNVLHEILKIAESYEMTVQFHTGYLAGNGGNLPDSHPAGLIPLFNRFPGISFDLFHMSYPYQMEAGALAKAYPNVFVNLCWAHIISPKAAVDTLEEWLHLLPVNKIVGFGGDTHIPFLVPGHLQMAKENIAKALERTVCDGLWTAVRAEKAAYCLLYENPKKLYKL